MKALRFLPTVQLILSTFLVTLITALPSESSPRTDREMSLPGGPIELNINAAEVHLQWEDVDNPSLSYRHPNEASVPLLQLQKNKLSPSIIQRIQAPNGTAEGALETLVLWMQLRPDQHLEIKGSDLDIIFDASRNSEEPAALDGAEVKDVEEVGDAPFPLRIEISAGALRMAGLRQSCLVVAEDSMLHFENPHQKLKLDLHGGQLEISGAQAPIDLTAVETAIQFNSESSTTMHLENARLSVGATKSLKAEAIDSYLDFFQSRANLTISGSGSTFNFTDVQLGSALIQGDNQNLYLKGRGTILRTNLSRSSVEIPRWKGRIETTMKEAGSFVLESLDGDLLFNISENSELKLKGITGHLRGQSHDSTMVFRRLKSMEVDVWNSRLEVSDLYEITKLNAVASHADISAPELRAQPSISLLEESSLELELPAPCIIEVKDPIEDWSSVIDAPNCGIKIDGRLSGNLSKSRGGGPQPIQPEVTIDSSSSLRAEVPL